jgi:DNA processing protein
MTEKDALLILNAVPELGPVGIHKLIQYFGSAEKILGVSDALLNESGCIRKKAAENILNWKKYFDLEKEYKSIEKNSVKVIAISDPEYPSSLKEIYDPPVVLYIKGDVLEKDKNAFAIVGAREASYYGINTARRFARKLAGCGFTIVSGCARGVDTAAHEGAIEGCGRTFGVFGSGIDMVYPSENMALTEKICLNGAIISEFPFGTMPARQNFPRRNRIISGLCRGVIVVEAGKFSGSLITARMAAEQGREVFSVPGRIDAGTSQGTNALIKDGAKPVFDIDDILEEFGVREDTIKKNSSLSRKTDKKETQSDAGISKAKTLILCGTEEKVFASLSEEPYTVDEIVNTSSVPVNEVWSNLVNLELKGLIKRVPGSKFMKKMSD